MKTLSRDEITRLLMSWGDGDPDALARLMPLVIGDLRTQARRYLDRESAEHTLQPTALVNELYLKLRGSHSVSWKNRKHFFGFAAQAMRRILVDHARARKTSKRGDGVKPVPLDEALNIEDRPGDDLIALEEAMSELDKMDPRQARIVELRFYVGLTVEETAEVLDVSPATVKREWKLAKLFLYGRIRSAPPGEDDTDGTDV